MMISLCCPPQLWRRRGLARKPNDAAQSAQSTRIANSSRSRDRSLIMNPGAVRSELLKPKAERSDTAILERRRVPTRSRCGSDTTAVSIASSYLAGLYCRRDKCWEVSPLGEEPLYAQ